MQFPCYCSAHLTCIQIYEIGTTTLAENMRQPLVSASLLPLFWFFEAWEVSFWWILFFGRFVNSIAKKLILFSVQQIFRIFYKTAQWNTEKNRFHCKANRWMEWDAIELRWSIVTNRVQLFCQQWKKNIRFLDHKFVEATKLSAP